MKYEYMFSCRKAASFGKSNFHKSNIHSAISKITVIKKFLDILLMAKETEL